MANYIVLKQEIQRAIKQNGNKEITGNIMQDALLDMIASLGSGYQFKGLAPGTLPTPDENIFYLAPQGEYWWFDGEDETSLLVGNSEIGVLCWNGTWNLQLLHVGTYFGGVNPQSPGNDMCFFDSGQYNPAGNTRVKNGSFGLMCGGAFYEIHTFPKIEYIGRYDIPDRLWGRMFVDAYGYTGIDTTVIPLSLPQYVGDEEIELYVRAPSDPSSRIDISFSGVTILWQGGSAPNYSAHPAGVTKVTFLFCNLQAGPKSFQAVLAKYEQYW